MFTAQVYSNILKKYCGDNENEGQLKIKLSSNGLESLENIEVLAPFALKLDLSNNSLSDISRLQGFVHLAELNVAFNKLQSVDCLKNLINLEELDIQGNLIASIDNLSFIESLKNLRRFFILGNKVCEVFPSYFEQLRLWQPNLRFIDDQPCADISADTKEDGKVVSSHELELMQRQIESFQTSFDISEELLGKDARNYTKEVERYFLDATFRQSNPGSADPEMINRIRMVYRETNRSFPFHRMLAHWRSECLKQLTQVSILYRRFQIFSEEKRQAEQQHLRRRQESDAKILTLEKRATVQQEKIGLLEQEKASLIDQLQQHFKMNQQIMKKYLTYRENYSNCFGFVKQYYQQRAEEQLASDSILFEKLEQLRQYEVRLGRMKEQLEGLVEVLQFQDLKLRNEQAMLDLERRLLYSEKSSSDSFLQHQQQTDKASPEASSESSMILSKLTISVEAEAFLKTIFTHLDFNKSGLIPMDLLLRAIVVLPSSFTITSDSSVVEEVSNNANWKDNLTGIGKAFKSSLNNSDLFELFLNNLLESYQQNQDGSLSWGEVLLQFIPPVTTSDHLSTMAAYKKDLRELSLHQMVESIEFSVFPYHLPVSIQSSPSDTVIEDLVNQYSNLLQRVSTASTSNTSINKRSMMKESSSADQPELTRLRLEKRLLAYQVQMLTRQITRTADLVRSYYDSKLLTFQRKESRWDQERLDFQQEVSRLQQRLEEVSLQHQQFQQAAETARQESEALISELRSQLDSNVLVKQREQSRLEMENMNLLAQCKRKDTQQALLEKQLERKISDCERLEKEKQVMSEKYEAEIQRLQQTQTAESQRVQGVLQENQTTILSLREKLVQLEEEKLHLQQQLQLQEKQQQQIVSNLKGAVEAVEAEVKVEAEEEVENKEDFTRDKRLLASSRSQDEWRRSGSREMKSFRTDIPPHRFSRHESSHYLTSPTRKHETSGSSKGKGLDPFRSLQQVEQRLNRLLSQQEKRESEK